MSTPLATSLDISEEPDDNGMISLGTATNHKENTVQILTIYADESSAEDREKLNSDDAEGYVPSNTSVDDISRTVNGRTVIHTIKADIEAPVIPRMR